jgi:hypothetical protein
LKIPGDNLLAIFSQLDLKDILVVSQVCKKFQEMIHNHLPIWSNLWVTQLQPLSLVQLGTIHGEKIRKLTINSSFQVIIGNAQVTNLKV